MPLHQFSSQLWGIVWGTVNQKEKGLPSEEDKPLKYHGGAGRIRTLGQRLRRPLLYPTELLPRERCLFIQTALGGQAKNGKKF